MPVDQSLEDGRVVFDCPTCNVRLTLGPPAHNVTIGVATGISVEPRFMCPDCKTVGAVKRGQVQAFGKRIAFPHNEPVVMPATRRTERGRVVVDRRSATSEAAPPPEPSPPPKTIEPEPSPPAEPAPPPAPPAEPIAADKPPEVGRAPGASTQPSPAVAEPEAEPEPEPEPDEDEVDEEPEVPDKPKPKKKATRKAGKSRAASSKS